MLDAEFRMPDARCWLLDCGCWLPDAEMVCGPGFVSRLLISHSWSVVSLPGEYLNSWLVPSKTAKRQKFN